MKYDVKSLTGAEYLHLVNSESDPDTKTKEYTYGKLGKGYIVVLRSGFGKFTSPLYTPEKELTDEEVEKWFDEQTAAIDLQYDARKGSAITYNALNGIASVQ